MDNIATYRYDQKNLLADRYHYQYTPFEGVEFLKAYTESRRELRYKLETARSSLLIEPNVETTIAEEIRQAVLDDAGNPVLSHFQNYQNHVLPAQPGDSEITTYHLLLDLWHSIICNRECEYVRSQWLKFLIQRFEVTKRLYIGYTSSLKPSKRIFDIAENYALLATLLLYQYKVEPNLKYINTVLKVVDLLASIGPLQQSDLTQLTSLVAIEAEQRAMKHLLRQHHISL